MEDKLHFRALLKLCQQNKITVWADPNLKRDKATDGHWNGGDHISVYRPNQHLCNVSPDSSDERIAQFIDKSPNMKWEMAVLLHEFGHWFFKHPHLSTVDAATGYGHEIEAWNKGEEVGRTIGINDFSTFYSDRDEQLQGYKVGLGINPVK